jgi:hypothetical protein
MRIDFVGGAVVQFVLELKSLDDRPTESDYSFSASASARASGQPYVAAG